MPEYNYFSSDANRKIKKLKFHKQKTEPLKIGNNTLKDFLFWLAIGVVWVSGFYLANYLWG